MAKSKRIAQIVITGLSLCILTIASQKYTNASKNNTAVKTVIDTQTKSQTIIMPEDYKQFSFYMPAANPIANIKDNTDQTSENTTETTEQTDNNITEQADTKTDTDTVNTSATDVTTDTRSDESQSAESNEPTKPTAPPEPATSGICEKDGYVDDHWISDINAQLAMIPSNLITEFQNDGWHIYCTDMDIDAVYYNGQFGAVMGTTNYDEHRILIEDRQVAVTDAAIHEMGHWLDWHNGTVTNSDEFMNIYYTETDIFKSTFHMTCYYDQKELFAEAFWKYLTDNQQLANSCPKLYDFMARYV